MILPFRCFPPVRFLTADRFFRSLPVLVLAILAASCSTDEPVATSGTLDAGQTAAGQQPRYEIEVLSTQPWLLSGGDALVEVRRLEAGIAPMSFWLNGAAIAVDTVEVGSGRYQFLLQSLQSGDNLLEVADSGSTDRLGLTLTNYPAQGPIISGPHESPFYCQTDEFVLATGERAGPELESDCSIAARVDYLYWSEASEDFRPLPANWLTEPPLDMGTLPVDDTVTGDAAADGEDPAKPLIVRVETGTVNRAIYEIAMLHDPREGEPSPWRRSAGWNNKLVYTHGGGCRSGWYQQGTATGGVLRKGLLEKGYALASSTLNVFGQNCNDLLASETHIMLKERFIERYGVPTYTVATGVSGGSYQSQQTADNYPGVFDGIIVGLSFPDVTSATIFTLADSRLLHHYFTQKNPDAFTQEQQRAIAGFGVHASIANLSRGAARLDPLFDPEVSAEEQGGEVSVPELESQRYSEAAPQGVRATVYDHTVNVYGLVEGSFAAQRPLDNVGVQYGLAALNAGVISPRQFIDLNRDIGGFDRDMNHMPNRHQADAHATYAAIGTGRILHGGAGLASTPIIDYRSYLDQQEAGDIHMLVHQYSTRARLMAANGHADNQVMEIGGRWGFSDEAPDLGRLFDEMDAWLMGILNDASELDDLEKLRLHKPASLTDACWDRSGEEPLRIEERQTYLGDSDCNRLYPAFPTPRQVAGAPLANDVVACTLKPVNRFDYTVDFSEDEFAELRQLFSQGVCDWSQGDRSGAVYQGSWLSFGPSPINRVN